MHTNRKIYPTLNPQELQGQQEEISNIMGEPMAGAEFDEDEMDEEMARLMAEDEETTVIDSLVDLPAEPTKEPTPAVRLPPVPQTEPVVSVPAPASATATGDDAELAELEALMA